MGLSAIMAAVQQLDGVVTAIQIKSPGHTPTTFGWLGGGAIQLTPPCDGELGLAEGIESALSATQLHGVPCWATLGAKRLDAIDLPSCVRRLHLFADNDEAGRAAVERAKQRYTNRLLPVRTWWPPDGQDWNDVLKGKAMTQVEDTAPVADTAPAFTEEAIALEFAKRHADALRYVATWSRWSSGMETAGARTRSAKCIRWPARYVARPRAVPISPVSKRPLPVLRRAQRW